MKQQVYAGVSLDLHMLAAAGRDTRIGPDCTVQLLVNLSSDYAASR